MKRRADSILIFTSLLVALALIIGFLLSANKSPDYQSVLNSCQSAPQNNYVSCLNASILKYSDENHGQGGDLLSYVYSHVRYARNIDVRELTDTAHYTGMEMSDQTYTLSEAMKDCGAAFDSSCRHGYVMDHLDDTTLPQAQLVQNFFHYCQQVADNSAYYGSCVHGVGHEFWAKTNLSLNVTLHLCDGLKTAAYQADCQSGILMEYSKGSNVKGHHTHLPAGKKVLPCSGLDSQFQETCIDDNASYRQYVPGWESPLTTYSNCLTAPASFQLNCMENVSSRLLLARAGNPGLADSTCAQLTAGRAMCYQSIHY